MNNELTLLTLEEVIDEEALSVLKRYGSKAGITHFALNSGAAQRHALEGTWGDYAYLDEDIPYAEGSYWVRTPALNGSNNNYEIAVVSGDSIYGIPSFAHFPSVRPVLDNPYIYDMVTNHRLLGYNDTEEVEYGFYPQEKVMIFDPMLSFMLEELYNMDVLGETGKVYTTNKITLLPERDLGFEPHSYKEYSLLGERYVRVDTLKYDLFYSDLKADTNSWWYKVSPVKWLIDDERKRLISKYGLIGGIRFDSFDKTIPVNYDGFMNVTNFDEYFSFKRSFFETSEMYEFLNSYLGPEMFEDYYLEASFESEIDKLKRLRDRLTHGSSIPYRDKVIERTDKVIKLGRI